MTEAIIEAEGVVKRFGKVQALAGAVLRAYSAPKLARLTAVKTACDPDNVFHLNHNIKPASR